MMSMAGPEVVTLSDDEEEAPRSRKRVHADNGYNSVPMARAEISMGAPINLNNLLGRLSTAGNIVKPIGSLLKQINNTPSTATARASLPSNGQNGATWNRIQPNSQIPTSHIIRKVGQMEPEVRLKTYTFEARDSIDDENEVVHAKLKCTYHNCSKIMEGNVAFITHLWSHIVEVVPMEVGDRKQRQQNKTFSDIRSITTCQQCLSAFESPFKLQVHYTRCHSRLLESITNAACQICEKEVPVLLAHLSRHPPRVAPYVCQVKTCQYRTTQRMVLFNHYIEAHANSMHLWCPFCSYTEQISRSQLRTKDVVTCKSLVEHMMEHARVLNAYRCPDCAYVFVSRRDMESHRARDHVVVPQSWTIKHLPANSFQHRKMGRIQSSALKGTKNCTACISDGASTLTKCSNCKIAAYEAIAQQQKKHLKEKFNNKDHPATTSGRYLNECECGFTTRNGNLMAAHRLKICNALGLMDSRMDETTKPSQEDLAEAKVFAVVHPESSTPELTNARNDLEALNKIKDEFADIDDLEMLVYKQFLVRSQVNDIRRSFHEYDLLFKKQQ